MPGELIVCPTPIGNLDDVSPRVRDALVAAQLGPEAGMVGAAAMARIELERS